MYLGHLTEIFFWILACVAAVMVASAIHGFKKSVAGKEVKEGEEAKVDCHFRKENWNGEKGATRLQKPTWFRMGKKKVCCVGGIIICRYKKSFVLFFRLKSAID